MRDTFFKKVAFTQEVSGGRQVRVYASGDVSPGDSVTPASVENLEVDFQPYDEDEAFPLTRRDLDDIEAEAMETLIYKASRK